MLQFHQIIDQPLNNFTRKAIMEAALAEEERSDPADEGPSEQDPRNEELRRVTSTVQMKKSRGSGGRSLLISRSSGSPRRNHYSRRSDCRKRRRAVGGTRSGIGAEFPKLILRECTRKRRGKGKEE